MGGESCQTCRFWLCNSDPQNNDFGTCCRFPPAVLPDVIGLFIRDRIASGELLSGDDLRDAVEQELDHTSIWAQPLTGGGDWCGEYRPKAGNNSH